MQYFGGLMNIYSIVFEYETIKAKQKKNKGKLRTIISIFVFSGKLDKSK